MRYKCEDVFMIRIPTLSLQDYFKIVDNKDILKSGDYAEYLDKALIFSSESMRTQFKKYTTGYSMKNKKIRGLQESVYSYLIRSSTRPTPFGKMGRVSLGIFSKDSKNIQMKYNKEKSTEEIFLDNELLLQVIKKFEDNEEIFKQLHVVANRNCYKYGNRFKNPFGTNGGISREKFDVNLSIRYTKLIEKIEQYTQNPIKVEALLDILREDYPEVGVTLIIDTLLSLKDNDYIFTNLRFPVFINDKLQYFIDECKQINILDRELAWLYEKLTEINNNLNDSFDLDEIISIGGNIANKINFKGTFLNLNAGADIDNNNLCDSIKSDLEEFANLYSEIFVDRNDFRNLDNLVQAFQETYGPNVMLPLVDFIDENGFNACKYIKIDDNPHMSRREKNIEDYMDEKIIECIRNGENTICFTEDDIKLFGSISDDYMPNSFDVNVYITRKNNNEFNYFIGPNFGSEEAGIPFQRFSNVFNKTLLEKYNKIYEYKKNIESNGYFYCEIRELSSTGKTNNIINSYKCYDHYCSFGLYDINDEASISIKDLYVLLDNSNFFIVHKRKNKIVKFVTNNMLNVHYLGPISRLLVSISSKYTHSYIHRFTTFENLKRNYLPRIQVGKVIVSPQTWRILNREGKNQSFEEFHEKFLDYAIKSKLPRYIYMRNTDNRLLLDLEDPRSEEVIYREYKNNKMVEFSEIEDDLLTGSMISDDGGNHYIAEFVFSFLRNKPLDLSKVKYTSGNIVRVFPFEEGWSYFKLYGCDGRIDELVQKIYTLEISEYTYFIRYIDEIGIHIRLRQKYNSTEESLFNTGNFIKSLKELQSLKLINNVSLATYMPEVDRYGGINCFSLVEEFFVVDSKFSLDKLQYKTDEERMDHYFAGVIPILDILADGIYHIDAMLSELDDINIKNMVHKNKEKYIKIYNAYHGRTENSEIEALRNEKLERIKIELNRIEDEVYKNNIIMSIAHMYCNRIDSNREYERYILGIIKCIVNYLINSEQHGNL